MIVALISVGRTARLLLLEASRRKTRRELGESPQAMGDVEGVRETIDALTHRLERLEEERDFYRDLLEAPGSRPDVLPPSGK